MSEDVSSQTTPDDAEVLTSLAADGVEAVETDEAVETVAPEADDAVEPRGRASKGYSGGEIASLPSLSPNERMSPWLANRVAHILAEEYTQGTSIQELANRSGYSIARVRSLLKKSGVPFRDRGRRRTATPA